MTISLLTDKPGPPQNLKATKVTENTVTLVWEDPEEDGGCLITGYVVERRDAGKRAWQQVADVGDMEFEVTGLSEGQSYNFRVAAVNEVGTGEFVEMSKSIAPKSQHNPPGAPSAPEVTEITKESCVLTWEAPEDDGGSPVTGYFLDRRPTESSRWLRVTKDQIPELTNSVTDLIEDTEYVFRVVAANKIGEGPPGPESKPFVAKDPWSKLELFS